MRTECVTLRATINATGAAIATARMVPSVAMCSVSIKRRMDDLGVPGPVDRPHPHEQIGGLLRRVVKELRDDLDRAQRPHDRDQRDQVEHGAHDALGGREALPLPKRRRVGPLRSLEQPAHETGQQLADHDHRDDGEHDGQHEVVVEALERGEQRRADAAAADQTRPARNCADWNRADRRRSR